MIHHVVTWPFKKINDWLRSYYQNKQIKQQTALLEQQLLLETTPVLDVSIKFVYTPDPPRRPDIPLIYITIQNYGGTAYITEGRIWITYSDRPADKPEEHIADTQMPKGKKEEFCFQIVGTLFNNIITGHSVLKLHYDLHFHGPDKQPQQCTGSRTYNPQKKVFVMDK